jgi:hypothetical protein
MEIAAALARDKFTMSLIEPPRRTRHIPGHLESGSIVATTRRPDLSIVRLIGRVHLDFTRRQCATGHKRGIHRYIGRAGCQIATLFERAA